MRRFGFFALAAGLTACAPVGTPNYVDPNAKEEPAVIVAKRQFAEVQRRLAGGGQQLTPDFVAPGVFIPGRSTPTHSAIGIYEYTVRTQDGREVKVVNEFSAFEVGYCVRLMTSPHPSYPRIAGDACPKAEGK